MALRSGGQQQKDQSLANYVSSVVTLGFKVQRRVQGTTVGVADGFLFLIWLHLLLTEADLLEQRDVGVSALEGELHRLREGLWMSDYVSFGHYNVHTYMYLDSHLVCVNLTERLVIVHQN